MSDLIYCFQKDINVKRHYERVLTINLVDRTDIENLSKNFVSKGTALLKGEQNINIKHDRSVMYDKKTEEYRATVSGYVDCTEEAIEVYPLVMVDEDKMHCYGIAPMSSVVKGILTPVILEEALRSLHVRAHPNKEGISNFFASYRTNIGGKFLLVEGDSPINGHPMKVELLRKMKAGDSHKVMKGQKIGTYAPEVIAKDGLNVYGEVIESKQEEAQIYELGRGLKMDPQEKVIFSQSNGIMEVSQKKNIKHLSVYEQEVIEGDVDLVMGNVESNSSLLIKGSVLKGVKVRSTGSIEVMGNVEEANMDSDLNIKIHGGALGKRESFIKAGGQIEVGHVTDCRIECNGDLLVKNYLVSSNVMCRGIVCIENNQKGKIIGGVINALQGIRSPIVGNPSGTKTHLITGLSREMRQKFKVLETKIKDNDQELLKVKVRIGKEYFAGPKEYLLKNKDNIRLIQVS